MVGLGRREVRGLVSDAGGRLLLLLCGVVMEVAVEEVVEEMEEVEEVEVDEVEVEVVEGGYRPLPP